jgi:O-antigen/teichoic acid export membrane protein
VGRHWQSARAASRRLTWGVADQGVSSLTNFLLAAVVARTLGASGFGAFSLAYVTYGFALNASRGLAAEPLMIRFSATDNSSWRHATAQSTGTALLLGAATGTCAFTVGIVAGGATGHAFLALGLTLPGLLLQDNWRFSFFSLGRGRGAFINDTIWAGVQIPLLLLAGWTGHADVFWFVLAWGVAAGVAALAGGFQTRLCPNVLGAREWLSDHRDLGPRYVVENTGTNSADILRAYGVASILGLSAVGHIQGASVLVGPLKIVIFGISMTAIPEGARMLRDTPRRLASFCAVVSMGLTALACIWTIILLVGLPHGIGHLMLGDVWRPAYPLVLPTSVAFMANCVGIGAGIGLHALGASRRSLRAGLTTSAVVVICALVGAVNWGALGSLRLAAAGSCACALLYWWQLRQALMESAGVDVPSWLWPPSRRDTAQTSASVDADI